MELDNALNWFEIPVSDFNRGKKFYETIFDYQMPENQMGTVRMGFFLYDFQAGKVGGALCQSPIHVPSQQGSLIYLNCGPDLQVVLDRVENAGGIVLQSKTPVSPTESLGFIAFIADSEGNKIALHSMG